jgi:predicted nucleotidyltransferase
LFEYRTIFCFETKQVLRLPNEKSQIELIRELCKTSKVKSLFAFGSVTRGDFNESSDHEVIPDEIYINISA